MVFLIDLWRKKYPKKTHLQGIGENPEVGFVTLLLPLVLEDQRST